MECSGGNANAVLKGWSPLTHPSKTSPLARQVRKYFQGRCQLNASAQGHTENWLTVLLHTKIKQLSCIDKDTMLPW